ncbi:polar amino acid transport system permease protein/polar amino acid transport system substrate-binding protein [Salipaludibacillus aurantiacus]|uniref:Polar amino acid transport system permease protein/polar amino acid transport system substrate-binding protein n=2 Tax=Salipaludibacillus aurantiacus TaxID=1601833 RepID=A0A1H9W4Q0_9BACI|nr:polar amino acid transport system permease protein/polar amino acid transport system substrate-binding protein [Salipaludibacillus aurantiacus]
MITHTVTKTIKEETVIESLQIMIDALPVLLQGMWLTVLITVISLAIALVIGLVLGIFSITQNKILRGISTFYVDAIRGTPILVQILFIYFGLPAATDLSLNAFTAGIIAISINAGAYLVEIFRAGINSIDKGQMEAGRTLGFSYGETMRLIILPQAVKRMIPAIVNQFIVSIKDTSILSVIGIAELTMSGQSIYANNFRAFEILFMVGVLYFVIVYSLTLFARWLERRLDVA